MSNDIRIAKFEILIREINRKMGFIYPNQHGNDSLRLIYDYEKLNEYGKVIMDQSYVDATRWNNTYYDDSLKDSQTKVNAVRELVSSCRENINSYLQYKFIFWAMMVLTVDKTDQEEKLTLICDFVRMLKISDEEVIDILYVIKFIYHEEEEGYEFKSKKLPWFFDRILELYR